MSFAFGDFRLDDETRQLLRAGREVPLGPKAFELLELLVRARPRALSRTRLHATLWPDAHVGATSLHVLVSQLRAALGDDPREPRFIRTVHRFGYAFRGDTRDEAPGDDPSRYLASPRLTLDEREWVLGEGESVLGRDAKVAIRIEKAGISRRHARITIGEGKALIEDLGSKNGTSVGGEKITSPRPLRNGDRILLGRRTCLVFHLDDKDTTETEASAG